jgi:hypothetical protein
MGHPEILNQRRRRLVAPRFEPYSNLDVILYCKGGGKPPHSKVGWRRGGAGGYAIVFARASRLRRDLELVC